MKKGREERKKELEGKAQEMIERLMAWEETHQEPNLTQMEDIVLELRGELGQAMLSSMLSNQEKVAPVSERCSTCGAELRGKGKRRKVLESRVGEIAVERGYYTCPECGTGLFPPGSTVASGRTEQE